MVTKFGMKMETSMKHTTAKLKSLPPTGIEPRSLCKKMSMLVYRPKEKLSSTWMHLYFFIHCWIQLPSIDQKHIIKSTLNRTVLQYSNPSQKNSIVTRPHWPHILVKSLLRTLWLIPKPNHWHTFPKATFGDLKRTVPRLISREGHIEPAYLYSSTRLLRVHHPISDNWNGFYEPRHQHQCILRCQVKRHSQANMKCIYL